MNIQALFLMPPYTYMSMIDIRSGDWVRPSSLIICEVRCKSEGTVLMDFRSANNYRWLCGNYDILRGYIDRIYKFGTDRSLRRDNISIHGFLASDINRY